MLSTNPYLHFMGTAEEAMNYYQSILGGEIVALQRYGDIPGGEKMPAGEQEKIMHVNLVGKGFNLMASDSVKPMAEDLCVGNNIHLCLQAENEVEVNRLFKGLSKDGVVEMPPNKTFWGAYFAMCKDQFGIYWMINYTEVK